MIVEKAKRHVTSLLRRNIIPLIAVFDNLLPTSHATFRGYCGSQGSHLFRRNLDQQFLHSRTTVFQRIKMYAHQSLLLIVLEVRKVFNTSPLIPPSHSWPGCGVDPRPARPARPCDRQTTARVLRSPPARAVLASAARKARGLPWQRLLRPPQ